MLANKLLSSKKIHLNSGGGGFPLSKKNSAMVHCQGTSGCSRTSVVYSARGGVGM